jgi:hypothetical protein
MSCQLTVGPFYQCCCSCIYHVSTAFHCCTNPKPDGIDENNIKTKDNQRMCVCETQKGYACIVRLTHGGNLIHDAWPLHSVGCELFEDRNNYKLEVDSSPKLK